MNEMIRWTAIATVASLGVFITDVQLPVAIAQDAPISEDIGLVSSEQVNDEQVTQLVRSLLAIQPLLEESTAQLQAAETEEQRWEIERSFIQLATSILEARGLTVEQYRQLMALANNDEAFSDRVASRLDELQP